MARFLMMTAAADGHVTPSRPIARKLVDRGHEVIWITGRSYRQAVESTGARFHAAPSEIDPGEMEWYAFHPELKGLTGVPQIKRYIRLSLDAAVPIVECASTVLSDFPADALIGDTMAFGLVFLSEITGLPMSHISLLPLSLPSRDTAPWGLGLQPGGNLVTRTRNRLLNYLVYHMLFRDVTTHANCVRRTLGLPRLNRPFFEAMYARNSLILHISTPAFEYGRSDRPESLWFVGPILLESNRAFQPPSWWSDLDGPEPVILVNQGTIATVLDDLIVPAIRGLSGERMQIVAVPVKDGQLGRLAGNVHTDVFIPFDHLLPHVDVMVTNGGYGGTQLALAHGVPLVVAGETEDKREVAARVEWSGTGINLRKQRPSPEVIRKAVKEVLGNPVFRENAKRIQADFAKCDAPTRAAELLEALARGEKPR